MSRCSSLAMVMAGVALSIPVGQVHAGGCTTDLDDNGATDVGDLIMLIGQWGSCPGCAADLNGDDQVAVNDLIRLLGAWGTCGFQYPDYPNELANQVGIEFVGPTGPLTVSRVVYDRMDHDIAAIQEIRPEIVGGPHFGDWVPKEMLVCIDTSLPQDAYLETIDYYGAEITESWFDGAIELIEFPQPVNIPAAAQIFEPIANVSCAEPNGYTQLPLAAPGFHPTAIGGDAIEWTVVVPWWQGMLCDWSAEACQCYTIYQFISPGDGSVVLQDIQSGSYDFGTPYDCSTLPPDP